MVHHLAHLSQHNPLASVGFFTEPEHIVGKHHAFLQNALGLPPLDPLGPVTPFSSLMSGFTQYGQQCPGTLSCLKPAGHVNTPHLIAAQGSTMSGFLSAPPQML